MKPKLTKVEMLKKLKLKQENERKIEAATKIQNQARVYLFMEKLKYAFYKNKIKKIAAEKIFKLWREAKNLQLWRRKR